jgi:GDP-mannose 6-dehydrogenase
VEQMESEKVAIFGLGYVGCVTAACLARDGHEIVGIDINPSKVDAVANGIAPLEEPGLATLLAEAVQAGRLHATSSSSEAVLSTNVAIICVGTPTGPDEGTDLRGVAAAAWQIGAALKNRNEPYTVIMRSTVPPGTAEGLVSRTLRNTSGRPIGSGPTDIMILTVPEFLREATAIADYDEPPFFVVGGPTPPPERATTLVQSLFGRFCDRLHWVDYRTAELLKNVCNAYHAVKVVFANEVGALCEAVGINGIEMMQVFCQDRKLNVSAAYLRPGLPFGGSCLPKDLRALVHLGRCYGVNVPQLGSTLESNALHIDRAIQSIEQTGRKRIGLEGLAFKSGTDDVRESPMVAVAERLLGRGYDLRIFDPLVSRSVARSPRADLAHLTRLLVPRPGRFLRHAEVLVRGSSSNDLLEHARTLGLDPVVIDLGRPPYRVSPPSNAFFQLHDEATLPQVALA